MTTSHPPTFANRIIELAVNNRASSTTPLSVLSEKATVTPLLSSNDISSHQQDQASLSADLQLLSSLLGRPITADDLPTLTKQTAKKSSTVPRTTTSTTPATTTTRTTPKPPLSNHELQSGQEDLETINRDLQLLSTLLGRKVTIEDLPQLTQQFGGGKRASPTQKPRTTATPSTTTTTTTTHAPTTTSPWIPMFATSSSTSSSISRDEILALLRAQGMDGTINAPGIDLYGTSNEAVLAALLKQRGIGPANNNIPTSVSKWDIFKISLYV